MTFNFNLSLFLPLSIGHTIGKTNWIGRLNARVRGRLRTIFRYAQYIAIAIAFFAGSYFDYVTSSLYFIGITVTFLAAISFVPSTPQYFQQINKSESAEKASEFYYKNQEYTDQFESGESLAKSDESLTKLTWRDISKYF